MKKEFVFDGIVYMIIWVIVLAFMEFIDFKYIIISFCITYIVDLWEIKAMLKDIKEGEEKKCK